ncbi:MAG: hypothetical protein COT74_12655 [Bdellovibrionales bacterium CG10_big_fil_rev_8_21_14_0_10_45_34]|nr:MAG: hypothetical protein COT74_12655 [Bdellovibrionales bacterium CG10_big_fil_rev_8_21_14_0_10_45_34]
MSQNQFYVSSHGESVGPWTLDEISDRLASGELTAEEHIFLDHTGEWTPLADVFEFPQSEDEQMAYEQQTATNEQTTAMTNEQQTTMIQQTESLEVQNVPLEPMLTQSNEVTKETLGASCKDEDLDELDSEQPLIVNVPQRAGSFVLKVESDMLPELTQSIALEVEAAHPHSLEVSSSEGEAEAGTSHKVSIVIRDQFGNLCKNEHHKVLISKSGSAESFSALEVENGKGQLIVTNNCAESSQVTVSLAAKPAVNNSLSLRWIPAEPHRLALEGALPKATAGESMELKVALFDRFGNKIKGLSKNLKVTATEISQAQSSASNSTGDSVPTRGRRAHLEGAV